VYFNIGEALRVNNILQKFNLEGKSVVITGGAGVLGSVIAKGLG